MTPHGRASLDSSKSQDYAETRGGGLVGSSVWKETKEQTQQAKHCRDLIDSWIKTEIWGQIGELHID